MKIPLKFSSHAKEKMQSRKIKLKDVCLAIDEPDDCYQDVGQGTLIAVKKVNGNSLILVYKWENEVAKVITLFYTTKLDKLLKTKVTRGAWKKVK